MRLDFIGLAYPQDLVTAEDVSARRPSGISPSRALVDLECYHFGKQGQGLNAEADVLVIVHLLTGVCGGKAACCEILGLATTHDIMQLIANAPTWIVGDLRSVKFVGEGTGNSGSQVGNIYQPTSLE